MAAAQAAAAPPAHAPPRRTALPAPRILRALSAILRRVRLFPAPRLAVTALGAHRPIRTVRARSAMTTIGITTAGDHVRRPAEEAANRGACGASAATEYPYPTPTAEEGSLRRARAAIPKAARAIRALAGPCLTGGRARRIHRAMSIGRRAARPYRGRLPAITVHGDLRPIRTAHAGSHTPILGSWAAGRLARLPAEAALRRGRCAAFGTMGCTKKGESAR